MSARIISDAIITQTIMTNIPTPELAARVSQQLAKLYVTSRDRFVITKTDGTYIPRSKDKTMVLADSNLVKHVLREYAISVYCAKEGSRFMTFDVDAGGLDTVKKLVEAIANTGIKRTDIHISTSGKKGYHVELFFNDLAPLGAMSRFYWAVMKAAECSKKEVEFRPSSRLAIKLPLSVHPATGRMCWYLDRETLEEIADYAYLFSVVPMAADVFTELANGLSDTLDDERQEVLKALADQEEGNGFDILRMHTPTLKEPGTRHGVTVGFAVALRYRGVPMDACGEILLHWISKQDPDTYTTSQHEVFKDTWRIVKWVYKTASIRTMRCATAVIISRDDMRRVLSQRAPLGRKLYFFFVFNRHYRKPKRITDIAELVGASWRSVYERLAKLEKNKDVVTKQGVVKRTSNGMYCKRPNRYNIRRKPVPEVVAKAWPSDVYYHSFVPPETAEEFLAAYYGTIDALFPGVDVAGQLLKAEAQEYLAYKTRLPDDLEAEAADGEPCDDVTERDT